MYFQQFTIKHIRLTIKHMPASLQNACKPLYFMITYWASGYFRLMPAIWNGFGFGVMEWKTIWHAARYVLDRKVLGDTKRIQCKNNKGAFVLRVCPNLFRSPLLLHLSVEEENLAAIPFAVLERG